MAFDLSNGFSAVNNGAASLADGVQDLPIFDIERVQLQFSIAADFVAAQVANNVLVIALSNGRILRIDLNRPEDIDGKRGAAPQHRGNRALTQLFRSTQTSTFQRSPQR
jgi:X-X-X-Leu-X-X-Gly heptad repeat protein